MKVCSSLCNLLPGAGSKTGQVNLPVGPFKHFSNTGPVPKTNHLLKHFCWGKSFPVRAESKDNFLRGVKRVPINSGKTALNRPMIVLSGILVIVLGVTFLFVNNFYM